MKIFGSVLVCIVFVACHGNAHLRRTRRGTDRLETSPPTGNGLAKSIAPGFQSTHNVRNTQGDQTLNFKLHSVTLANSSSQEGVKEASQAGVMMIMQELLAVHDILPVQSICSKLSLDSTGCLRVEAYLGKTLLSMRSGLFAKPLKLKTKIHREAFNNEQGEATTKYGLEHAKTYHWWEDGHTNNFAEALEYVPGGMGPNHPFLFAGGLDQVFATPFKYPTLVRPAPVPDPLGNHVIVRYNRQRYEGPLEKLPSIDVPLEDKVDALVWRGSPTGAPHHCSNGQFPNRSRTLLVQKYFNTEDTRIDVGFSKGVANYSRGYMGMSSQLKNKFILVVDGYAEPGGMEWAMASNSVPFMPEPVVQTWTLHSWLKPWKHYVPVEPDFSDLSAKLDWAIANPSRVAQISKEGALFMQEFHDKDREKRINAAVIVAYLNRFKIEDWTQDQSISGSTKEQWYCP